MSNYGSVYMYQDRWVVRVDFSPPHCRENDEQEILDVGRKTLEIAEAKRVLGDEG